jgi:D-alanyl-D-alanine carboxypeptidase (penicillin-binding protein 5/6)
MRTSFKFKTFLISCLFLFYFNIALVNAKAPKQPNLAAKAYVLKDFTSNVVIASHHSDKRVEPASLTKIMTAYLSFQAIKDGKLSLKQNLPVSDAAFKAEGSRMFIEQRVPVNVNELLYGLIVQSGNDAAIALAEGVSGTEAEFAAAMNSEAKRLNLKNTHFTNATGLPGPEHYTTANDLVFLAEALIRDFPDEYKRYYSVKDYTYNKIKQDNRNRLLWIDSTVDGMKTGHTKSAGYCLIATAMRDGVRRISVVLGAPTKAARATESQKLLNYGYMHFETTKLYHRKQKVNTFKVWKGTSDSVDVTPGRDVYITLPKGESDNLKGVVSSVQPLIAPIKKGQKIGDIKLTLDGEVLQQLPLVARESVDSAGLFGQIWDSIKLYMQ